MARVGTRRHQTTPSASSARSRSSTTCGSVRSRGRGRATSSSATTRPGPRREQHDAVGQQHRLLDVVRDEQHGPRLAHERARQPALQLRARERVERAERLVEAQHRPAREQRAQERDALAHPARQLRGPRALEALEPERREVLVRRRPRLRASTARRRAARARRCRARSATAAARRAAASAPPARLSSVPASGSCSPHTSSSSVDLPQPLGPDDRDRLARRRAQRHVRPARGRRRTPSRPRRGPLPRRRSVRDEAPPREPRSVCASLPPRALPHRFEGSAPDPGRYLSRPSASPPVGPPPCYRHGLDCPCCAASACCCGPCATTTPRRCSRC